MTSADKGPRRKAEQGSIAAAGPVRGAWIPGSLTALRGLELVRCGFDNLKFRREAAYHMWSSKAWGISLFAGFYGLLVHGNAGLLAALPIYVGIAADLEGLVISAILREWRADVPSFVHALRISRP